MGEHEAGGAARQRPRMTRAQRREVGALLSGPRAGERHAARDVGEAYMKSASWMRTLRRRAGRGEEPRPPGRPRILPEERVRVRALVEEQRRLQGRTVGSPAILKALERAGAKASRMLVEQELAALKREDRASEGRAREAGRVGLDVLSRDAVWGEDTTHLGRLEDGQKVEAEVVKDLGTKETVGLSVGGVPGAGDVVALLERTAVARGGWPLVWMADQGSINRDEAVVERLGEERVVHLLSRVHTPTDNAATERQHREIKEEAGLGCGARISSEQEARERSERARERLDEGRLRATLGWRTAAEVGRELERADAVVDRDRFYREACSAMEEAVRGHMTSRAAQRARREALFATLVRHGLAVRHVGARPRVRPGPPPCKALKDRVECPGEGTRSP